MVDETLVEYKDLPYTVIGHTSLFKEFNVTLTARAIKEIARRCGDDDSVSIIVGDRYHNIVIHHKKEGG